jgi:putative ABC transport system permease protein
MILSYFRLAWKVLFQRRLYTLVILFGITFTLTILFVGTSLYDFMLKPNYPEYRQDRILVIDELIISMVSKGGTSTMSNGLSYSFIRKQISGLKTPKTIGISKKLEDWEVYRYNHKIKFVIRSTDTGYWKIFDFKCIDGKLYGETEIKANSHVAVISESTARKYFGTTDSVVGKPIEIGTEYYKVIGIVRDVPENRTITHCDIWLPLVPENEVKQDLMGLYSAYLLSSSESGVSVMKKELENSLKDFKFENYEHVIFGKDFYKDFTNIKLFANTHVEKFFRNSFGVEKSLTAEGYSDIEKVEQSEFYLVLTLLFFLMMVFPSINLINIHVSRYIERSTEIGIRRSYGAKKRIIIGQLLLENTVITALGSVFAIVASFVILHLIESSDLIPGAHFNFNFRILIWGFVIILIFNFFSSIIPAWKISRLPIIQSLKGGEQ